MSDSKQLQNRLKSVEFRHMPWRDNLDPYWIFVSEIMLQQTQVDRVIPKFQAFVQRFPTLESLSAASLPDVLAYWSGLGYNRRALWLLEGAKQLFTTYKGIPPDPDILMSLKGIGPHTARAICVYAFNMPLVFIETNVRAVFIHEFFTDHESVSDDDIYKRVEECMDTRNPRLWYWSVMDYGTHLKKHHPNPSRRSKHHVKQSAFEGSTRQVRGYILKQLVSVDAVDSVHIARDCDRDAEDVERILVSMCKDGLLEQDGPVYRLRQS